MRVGFSSLAMILTLRILAVLVVLAAAVALGWKPSSTAGAKRSAMALTGARTAGHRADGPSAGRVRRHAASAGVYARAATSSKSTAIDDDDEYDDDIVESGIGAPERRQADSDASPELTPEAPRLRPRVTLSSMHLTRRGIRPSGEHRSTTDRPPRA
jgi:hypothetical protein